MHHDTILVFTTLRLDYMLLAMHHHTTLHYTSLNYTTCLGLPEDPDVVVLQYTTPHHTTISYELAED